MSTIKAIERGIAAALAKPSPNKYEVSGRLVVCTHCRGENFWPFDFTKFLSLGSLREQHGLECSTCSHLEIFVKEPVEI
jgi:hypothetical protein